MQSLNITLIQSNLYWEKKQKNIDAFSRHIESIEQKTDIIMLPEMFATGFTMNATQCFETMDGNIVKWMLDMAGKKNAAVCGSLIIKENNKFYNRFIWAEANGNMQHYDKAHLFRMGDEQQYYSSGSSRIMIEYCGWRIAPFVCYDLRFPVWLKRSEEYDYDLMLIVANWPERRNMHWKVLSQARAIENQCFLVALNRVGYDGNGIYHSGDSSVYSPMGELMLNQSHDEVVKTITIDKQAVTDYRKIFPVHADNDKFVFTANGNAKNQ